MSSLEIFLSNRMQNHSTTGYLSLFLPLLCPTHLFLQFLFQGLFFNCFSSLFIYLLAGISTFYSLNQKKYSRHSETIRLLSCPNSLLAGLLYMLVDNVHCTLFKGCHSYCHLWGRSPPGVEQSSKGTAVHIVIPPGFRSKDKDSDLINILEPPPYLPIMYIHKICDIGILQHLIMLLFLIKKMFNFSPMPSGLSLLPVDSKSIAPILS